MGRGGMTHDTLRLEIWRSGGQKGKPASYACNAMRDFHEPWVVHLAMGICVSSSVPISMLSWHIALPTCDVVVGGHPANDEMHTDAANYRPGKVPMARRRRCTMNVPDWRIATFLLDQCRSLATIETLPHAVNADAKPISGLIPTATS